MQKPIQHLFLLLFLLLPLVGCNRQPDIQPMLFNTAPWQPNEVSRYQLTDLDGNYAGTARFDITESGNGGWNLRREIYAQGTQEIIAIDMSANDFRPRESTLIRIDPNGREVVRSKYSGSQVDMELTTKQNITTQQRVSIPSDAREQASLVMLLRALPLAEGYATRMNVFWPVVGSLERATVQVVGKEQISVAAGTFDAWHVLVETPNSETDVWISTEAPYPVIKFIDSRNGGTFELSAFEPGE